MITIAQYPNMKLYWYDDDRTVLVGQAEPGWEWEYAHKAMKSLNDTISVWSQTKPIYVILYFAPNAYHFPKAGSALQHMRQILDEDPSEEILTVFVAEGNMVGNIIRLASRMYRIADNQSKFRYVTTFERALDVIKEHKLGDV